jgi:hypothetical protein
LELPTLNQRPRRYLDFPKNRLTETLSNILVEKPDSGDIIQGSGGIRKIRWAASGRVKRGGARVIYYWATQHDQIFMLYAYAKNERENLTKEQL